MGKKAFMFPGQGSQTLGMAQDLCKAFPFCNDVVDVAEDVLGRDIRSVMFGEDREALNMTVNTQTCLLVAELCCLRAIQSGGITAEAYVGFSLGEWAALVAAEVLGERQAFRLVGLRAQYIQ